METTKGIPRLRLPAPFLGAIVPKPPTSYSQKENRPKTSARTSERRGPGRWPPSRGRTRGCRGTVLRNHEPDEGFREAVGFCFVVFQGLQRKSFGEFQVFRFKVGASEVCSRSLCLAVAWVVESRTLSPIFTQNLQSYTWHPKPCAFNNKQANLQ